MMSIFFIIVTPNIHKLKSSYYLILVGAQQDFYEDSGYCDYTIILPGTANYVMFFGNSAKLRGE